MASRLTVDARMTMEIGTLLRAASWHKVHNTPESARYLEHCKTAVDAAYRANQATLTVK